MLTLEPSAPRRRVTWLSLLGLVLVPLLVAGGFLWATWNSDTRLDRVQAAIVNEDEPVRLDGQLVPLGRQLAGGLVTGGDSDDDNFSWLLTDAADAASGLADGRYAAVVTIPEEFSARATSFSKTEASQISPAEISVQTSQIRGIADTVVGQSIAAAATSALNTSLTEQYLDNIYVGFNETGEQFRTVARAAGDLADGTEKLSDGITQTSTGAAELADGLGQLDRGAEQLSSGAGQLSTGVGQLSTGLDKLADGTAQLPAQTRKLADGVQETAEGAGELADGAKKLSRGLSEFADGTTANENGTQEFAAGAEKFSDGLTGYTSGVSELNGGLKQYRQGIAALAENGLPACPADVPEAVCPVFQAGVQAGATAAVQGLDQPKGEGLLAGAQKLADNSPTIAEGGAGLADGAGRLSSGARKLDRGAKQLANGATGLSSGARQLAGGLDQLADGTDQLADGLKPLARGIRSSADGASQLATGASQLSSGTQDLTTGTGQSATGAEQLSDGLTKLSDGGVKLADGSQKLADGLTKGAEQVPSYDKSTRTKLAEVVATPVTSERPTSLFADIANTTFLAAIALWLGGLASYIVLRAVPSSVLTSMKASWRLATEALLPAAGIAAVQAVALTAVLQVLLELNVGQAARLLPFLLLAGVAFAAVNQALVAWLGGVGRFVSVALLVLAAAAAITSATPALLDVVTPFLPVTPALEGARAIVSDGTGVLGAVGLLLAWLVVGAAAAVLAVARRRMLPAASGSTRPRRLGRSATI